MTYKNFVLVAYAPIVEAGQAAEAIIDDTPVNFVELMAMDGSITEVSRAHDAIASKHGQRVIVLHIGSVGRLLDVMGAAT
ncbi:hypothetical protein [Alkanindiges illinoisensis]|uniref:Uncharacterized protein n=1 Tax=Alkanindiges illinoisensis TaxID=197183 RepID=A0A4Y7XAY3_9GAMM|nr:hypothetical protein [Alkanindiges illinoisensis]TEU25528.1 hypothetical protein E2B99_09155 [Alkanindiges illinoisensis]